MNIKPMIFIFPRKHSKGLFVVEILKQSGHCHTRPINNKCTELPNDVNQIFKLVKGTISILKFSKHFLLYPQIDIKLQYLLLESKD